ncbi:hypothetical protein B0F90DRAFT_1814108 [Multifurca ochricompacta]|uniref:Phospholipid/glycerol acyltransferase domain-containing protein n=1 Tax=Multifurca ochricompacta TaxID=376703 RepID=A0AAD4MCH0_9AGAM|nr:hypothetical protein B0F90DRAFT_1814108 [Multifurca ochricompacta]
MEKYSAFRDPGTGIQPFLTPVPLLGSSAVARIAIPLSYTLATIRTVLIMIIATFYLVFVSGACTVLTPVPPIHKAVSYIFTALLSRLSLLVLGVWWIPVEQISRKRGRPSVSREPWAPGAGDLIVSNWVSWIEVLWLAFRFDPIFVLPVSIAPVQQPDILPRARGTGRSTGTGSAAVLHPIRSTSQRANISGFRKVSLLRMITFTGNTPFDVSNDKHSSIEEIRLTANRPVVVFPECSTSNGRGLLRFAEVFKERAVPVRGYRIFVMCVRYDPPTALSPTLSHSIPSTLNPLSHVFSLAAALRPLTMSIRLLPITESPSSPSFMASEVISGDVGNDTLSAACAGLISQLGKLKRMSLSWEDKILFLKLYRKKES